MHNAVGGSAWSVCIRTFSGHCGKFSSRIRPPNLSASRLCPFLARRVTVEDGDTLQLTAMLGVHPSKGITPRRKHPQEQKASSRVAQPMQHRTCASGVLKT
eukprot:3536713-Pyramimonas_sp.AAC.1